MKKHSLTIALISLASFAFFGCSKSEESTANEAEAKSTAEAAAAEAEKAAAEGAKEAEKAADDLSKKLAK